MSAITSTDINEAARLSGLEGYKGSFRPLGGGELNDTFVLDCGHENVVLRVAKYPEQDSLEDEAMGLQKLALEGAPKLIYFDQKSRLQGRPWIMESYVTGTVPDRLSPQQYYNLGMLLAQVHQVLSGDEGIDVWSMFLDVCKTFADEKTLLNHPNPDLRNLINRGYKYFDQHQPLFTSLRHSLIHGDATPGNTLVDGDKVSLIDWEFCKFTDPMAEFSTIYYDDIELNRGRWRAHITTTERAALFEGYMSSGGEIDETRLAFWMNFDKLGASIFLYWRIHESGHTVTDDQMAQYKTDFDNLISSLDKQLPA